MHWASKAWTMSLATCPQKTDEAVACTGFATISSVTSVGGVWLYFSWVDNESLDG
jgi:hypothetical protein